MRKLTLTLTLFFTCFLYCNGQDYLITLSKQLLNPTDTSFYITQVIDVRPDKSSIGTVQTGIVNSTKTAMFEKELSEELASLFKKSFPIGAEKKPIIIKVIQFQIKEENKTFSENAIAEITLDFIYQNNPGEYLFLYQASSVVKSSGVEITSAHSKNIVKALNNCFEQFSAFDTNELITQAHMMEPSELEKGLAENIDTLDYSILKDTLYKRGIYQNFIEFRNNTPSITQSFVLGKRERTAKTWKGTHQVTPYLIESDGKRKNPKRAWGFSDGEDLYIHFLGEYYPLQKLGQNFTFYAHVPTSYPAIYYGGGIAGAIISGAVAGAASAAATNNSKASYVLDMVTGQIFEYGKYTYKGKRNGRGNPKIVVYFIGDKSAPDQNLNLVLTDKNDTLSTDMRLNSYTELEWSELKAELFVCQSNKNKVCLKFLPNLNKLTYLECKPRSTNPADGVEIKIVEEKVAKFYMKKINYLQELEERRELQDNGFNALK